MQAIALLLSAAALIALDQASKSFVIARFREDRVAWFGSLAFRRILNSTACGGLRLGKEWLTALWLFEIALLSVAVQCVPHLKPAAPVALGMALGGAGSNLLDHIRRGGVVDFIDFGFWPVFNLADIAIVAGVLIGVVSL